MLRRHLRGCRLKRRFFLFAPLPLVPVPGMFRGEPKEKEPREPRCSCERRGKDEPVTRPVGGWEEKLRVFHRDNEDLTIANTTTETDILNVAIPANVLIGDHSARMTLQGAFQVNYSSAVDITLRIYYGTDLMYEQDFEAAGTGGGVLTQFTPFVIRTELQSRSATVQEAFIEMLMPLTAVPNFGNGDIISYGGSAGVGYGTSVQDVTEEKAFRITVQFEHAHPAVQAYRLRSSAELT